MSNSIPQRISLEGFEREGDESQKLEIRLEDADLEVFRQLAGLPDDTLLIGGFPIDRERFSEIMKFLQSETIKRDLELFLVFGE